MTVLQAAVFALRSVVYAMEAIILLRVLCELIVVKRFRSHEVHHSGFGTSLVPVRSSWSVDTANAG